MRYHEYKMEIQQSIYDDPQTFFKHVENVRGANNDLPISMHLHDKTADSPSQIANLFRDFFESVYKSPVPDVGMVFDEQYEMVDKIQNRCSMIPPITINEEMVESFINQIPNNLVAGPDNIPNLFIKKCVSSLTKPITIMLGMAMDGMIIPDIWKSSFVRPIFKCGNRNDITNYRGVAIQCTIPKILDSIVASHLNNYLGNIIGLHQHGFVAGRSTTSNLMDFTSGVLDRMENNLQVDAIYLDVSKAFDTVDVELLCHKLNIMGVNNKILNLIHGYLHGRKQYVKLSSSAVSEPIHVTSGVGQGYPSGATLFIMFIMDLPHYIKNASIHLYADDAKMSLAVNSIGDCARLQDDINNANKFFNINHLKLNVKKTNMITFSRKHQPLHYIYCIGRETISRVTQLRDLGVILDEKMNFKSHIDFMVSKAKSRLAWIKRFSYEFNDPWVIKKLYMTFVLPIVEYASPIWSPKFKIHITRIESIQKQFLLFALRKLKWRDRLHLPKYEHRLLLLQMISLEDRRMVSQFMFVVALIFGKLYIPSLLMKLDFRVRNRFTRNSREIILNEHLHLSETPFDRIKQIFNKYYHLMDFNGSIVSIKSHIVEFFKKKR